MKTIRTRYGPSVRNWFLVLSMSQFHIPFYAGRTLPNFMILPGGTVAFILAQTVLRQTESRVTLIHRSHPQLLLAAALFLKFRSTTGHSLAASSLHLPPHLPRYQCPTRTRRLRDPPRAHPGAPAEGEPRGGGFLWRVRGIRRSSCVPPRVLLNLPAIHWRADLRVSPMQSSLVLSIINSGREPCPMRPSRSSHHGGSSPGPNSPRCSTTSSRDRLPTGGSCRCIITSPIACPSC